MASRAERSRSNVKAGVFVCVGILLGFVVISVLGDLGRFLHARNHYVLAFDLRAGVDGLSPGSLVRIGGLGAGRVTAVDPNVVDGQLVGALVRIEVERTFAIYSNARVDRVAPLLGGTASIGFVDVGDPAGGVLVESGGTIVVTGGAGGALAKLVGTENAARVSEILQSAAATLQAIQADYDSTIHPALAKFDEALGNARDLTASVKGDYGGWRARIDSTLGNIDLTAAKLPPLIDANRPSIDEIVANLRGASGDAKAILERVRTQMLDRVDALFAKASGGLDAFTAVAERLRTEIDTVAPPLESAVADARLTAQQLKLAAIELRRSPWRLLYRPSDKELDNELLYDAARSFALAAGDLEATAATVDRVLTKNADLLRADPAQAERFRTMLTESLRRYEEVQKQLFEVIAKEE